MKMNVRELKKLIKEAVNEVIEEKNSNFALKEVEIVDGATNEDDEWGGPLPREILEAISSEIKAKKISDKVVFLNDAPITSPWLSHDTYVRQHGRSEYDQRVGSYYDEIEKNAVVPFPRSKSEYLTGRIGSSSALDVTLDPSFDKSKLTKLMNTIARFSQSIMKSKGCKDLELKKPRGEGGGILVDATYLHPKDKGWYDPLEIAVAIGVLESSKNSKVLRIWSYWFRPV